LGGLLDNGVFDLKTIGSHVHAISGGALMVGTRTDNFYALYATLDANNVIAGAPGDSLLQVNADGFDAFAVSFGVLWSY